MQLFWVSRELSIGTIFQRLTLMTSICGLFFYNSEYNFVFFLYHTCIQPINSISLGVINIRGNVFYSRVYCYAEGMHLQVITRGHKFSQTVEQKINMTIASKQYRSKNPFNTSPTPYYLKGFQYFLFGTIYDPCLPIIHNGILLHPYVAKIHTNV